MSWTIQRLLGVAVGLVVLAGLVYGGYAFHQGYRALDEPFHAHQADFTGSSVCSDCHSDRKETWYQTYHRTMTQEAGPESVQGLFDGQSLDYWGLRVRPVQENGRYYFEYSDPDSGELLDRYEIHRTVGSNRYQQYLTRLPDGGTYVRLHYLWHNADARWVHMNAAFLGPDDKPFDEHVTIWNQNCIFCHNTGPQPGMTNYAEIQSRAAAGQPVDVTRDARFDSEVAELGISCEACHGPGSVHVARAEDFWSRMAMHASRGRDTSIVNPVRLDHERGSQVCGQCHAQRTPKDPDWIRDWFHTGPTFRAGMDLREHVSPVHRDTRTPVAGQEDLFRERFWGDGTPRLTAYEYQGMTQSACHQEAELSCMDCHTMHGGDPAGQITDRNRGNAPCLRCHQDFRGDRRLVEHTRHPADSEASVCYSCHMPDLAYGVMDIHRSHRIEVPDAVRDAATGRPNACLNCHLEKSPRWAAESLGHWPSGGSEQPIVRFDGGHPGASEGATVLAGDPVQKAVVAWRAGREDNHQRGRDRAWLVPYLLEAMADIYPSSRRFAHKSLVRILEDWPDIREVRPVLDALEDFDFIADEPDREPVRQRALERWAGTDKSDWPRPPPASGVDSDYGLPEAWRDELIELGRRQDKQISIGE